MDTKAFTLQLKVLDESGMFEGRLAIYNTVDDGSDLIEPGAFTKTLLEGGGVVPLLWQHDTRQPIGSLELRDTPGALVAKGRLVLSVPKAREAYDLMRAGVLRGLSIGYKAVKEQFAGDVRRLKELRLYEGSLVTIAMNPAAQVTAVKSHQEPEPDLEALEAFRNAARDLKKFHRQMIDGD